MSKKLTLQTVNAAHQAAADAVTAANAASEALVQRLTRDEALAGHLATLVGHIRDSVQHGARGHTVGAVYRDRLEATANSYGFTLADHPTRKDLVVVTPLEN